MINDNIGTIFGWEFKNKKTEVAAPYIQPQNDDGAFVVGGGYHGLNVQKLNLDQNFDNENDLIRRYRDISIQPEPDQAVTEIVNEAISGEDAGSPVHIVLDKVEFSKTIKDKIENEFDEIIRLLDFSHNSYEIFRKWYVDARLYYYIILDEKNPKNGIQELRYMSPLRVKKVREEIKETGANGIQYTKEYKDYFYYQPNDGYETASSNVKLKIPADCVCYVNSGIIDDDNYVVRGWLHKAMKPANQLRMTEDACVIYRLSRAPERRIFYIDVGNMNKQKSEEYMRNIMARSKNKLVYDAQSGEIKDQTNVLSMMEDLWLPRQAGGRGTQVDTLKGGENLGEIADIEYFKKRLYQSLNVPYSRIADEEGTGFNMGKTAQISREEVKFSKFISRLRKKFSTLFFSLLRTQLLLKNIITEEEWKVLKDQINFKFVGDSYYSELKETEIMLDRVQALKEFEPYIGSFYSKKYIQKKILQLSDEEISDFEKEMKVEKASGLYDNLPTYQSMQIDLAGPEDIDVDVED